jgi:heterodisulfide reductase subunit A
MERIGVFICHCGENIARTVDCARVAEAAGKLRNVVHAVDYKYMCSDPGQAMIRDAIREKGLTGLVVAACSPRMHEPTFRRAASEAGLNPYQVEMANIREHCSWVHEDRELATQKAIDLVRVMVEKVRQNEPLYRIRVPVTKRALVIGGGIAGIQAALDIADGGREVVLVERSPSIGGHMSQLSETFPTLDCSQCILTPRMVEAAQHPRITLHVYSEVEDVSGYIGNFEVKIRKKASSVNNALCTGCGACTQVCPVKKIPSEFDAGLGTRTAVYVPFPQAVPNKPVIDTAHCLRFKSAAKKGVPVAEVTTCGKCYEACPIAPVKAIDFSRQDEIITEKVGAIVIATGFELYPKESVGEYGYGKYRDVIDGLQFERLASASGPTGGEIRRPSDGEVPKTVVFIQCVGSRDRAKGLPYCSKICCMYTGKHAMLYKHKVHDGNPYIFYMDIRSGGKGYEEFVRRAIEEDGVHYVRGRVSRIYPEGKKLVVMGADTLTGTKVRVDADLVVLATAIRPSPGVEALAQKLGVPYDEFGFLSEAHPKLRPVETASAGVFLAGACQAAKDIPEAVAQASAAASKVQVLLSADELEREPTVAVVDENTCVGCFACEAVCPYGAVERKEIKDRSGRLLKTIAYVNPGVCQGCGTCVATCRSNSVDLAGFTDKQLYNEIRALG